MNELSWTLNRTANFWQFSDSCCLLDRALFRVQNPLVVRQTKHTGSPTVARVPLVHCILPVVVIKDSETLHHHQIKGVMVYW